MPSRISPLWRWGVTDLGGATLTFLDKLASDRQVTPKLNEPLEVSGSVPSDSPEINILHTDGFPFLAEGVRQLYCFRRESDSLPYYTIRASTLILQTDDAAASDDARTRFTAWDPWMYMNYRPVLDESLGLVGPDGLTYDDTWTADQIVIDLITNTVAGGDATAPTAAQFCFLDYGQTAFYAGTVQTCLSYASPGKVFQQGTSLADALTDICSTGLLDLEFRPIYDPVNRPGILCELSIWSQTAPHTGMGDYNYPAVFAWDRPGRSLVGADNAYDGTQRANYIQYYESQGGPPVTPKTDPASIAIYGQYEAQQFFPSQQGGGATAVEAFAEEQVALRSNFKQTLTVNPAPERSPEPFLDYYLGDRVPVYASDRMRQEIPPAGSLAVFQRVYGIPVEIDDNGVETVRELLVGPTGAPPPVAGAIFGAGIGSVQGLGVAVKTAGQLGRAGARGALGGVGGSRP